jgi:serine/threonine-protein phosphatase 2A activator
VLLADVSQGMIKMYNGEVLSKFPVVQHFPFGSLFSWELDPGATPPLNSVHTSSQPQRSEAPKAPSSTVETTRAPWASNSAGPSQIPTQAPWARQNVTPARAEPPTRAPWAAQPSQPNRGEIPTRAPWATGTAKTEEQPIKDEATKAP